MSLPVQIDTAARKQYLQWPEIASNDHLIRKQLIQANSPLVSATRKIPDHDIFVAVLSGIPLNAEMIAFYPHLQVLYPELIDHFTTILQGHGSTLTKRTGTAPAGEDIELTDALADLVKSPDEAREEGLPVPTDKALQNGEYVLREMYRIWPRRFEVYPMREGEIAIDAPSGKGRSVMVLCDSQGGALCLVNLGGGHRRARYSDARMLPDGFLREAISDMKKANGQE